MIVLFLALLWLISESINVLNSVFVVEVEAGSFGKYYAMLSMSSHQVFISQRLVTTVSQRTLHQIIVDETRCIWLGLVLNMSYKHHRQPVFLFLLTCPPRPVHSRMDLLPDVWRQDYWLPPGVTWTDMELLADSDRPQPLDLLVALPLALGFVALRCVFERYDTPGLCVLWTPGRCAWNTAGCAGRATVLGCWETQAVFFHTLDCYHQAGKTTAFVERCFTFFSCFWIWILFSKV